MEETLSFDVYRFVEIIFEASISFHDFAFMCRCLA